MDRLEREMHLTETHAASRWVWTYVTGQREKRLIVKYRGQESGTMGPERGAPGNRFRASDGSEALTIRKASGYSSRIAKKNETQELRLSARA